MKLEDATKEELVWWIKNNRFVLSFDEHRFESDILFRRAELSMEKALLKKTWGYNAQVIKHYKVKRVEYDPEPAY